MVRTTRSTMRQELADENFNISDTTANTMSSPQTTFDIPQRSSRAPSLVDMNVPSSGGSGRICDEDVTMQHTNGETHDEQDTVQSIGSRSRALIQGIRSVDMLGIKDADLALPKMIVVGDQSHGKSSIVEAACNLSMPRDFGTTTRCPFQITTTASTDGSPWRCEVTLSRRWNQVRKGQWEDTSAPPVAFATITDKRELERVLHLAQRAVLNPDLDPQAILRGGEAKTRKTLHFSFNAVELRVSGPHLPELSFIDLPGTINSVREGMDDSLVDVVKRLVKTYMLDEKALILLVAPADSDIETSQAVGLAKKHRVTDRCMGILTKPDLCGGWKDGTIAEILRNEVVRVGHEWFVMKNLAQDQLGTTYAQARQLEEDFFQQGIWANKLADHKDRFGTKNVQTAISGLLVEHIKNEIPGIIARVEHNLGEISEELDSMPQVPDKPTMTVMREAQNLAKCVGESIDDESDESIRATLPEMVKNFQRSLKDAHPSLRLNTPGYKKPALPVDDDESENEDESPSKRRKAGNGRSIPQSAASTPQRARRERETPVTSVFIKAVFTLDTFKRMRERASNIRNQCNPKVVEHFFREAITPWDKLAHTLLLDVKKAIDDMLVNSILKTVALRGETLLLAQTNRIVDTFCNNAYNELAARISRLIAHELRGPETYNEEPLNERTTDLQAKAQQKRIEIRTDEHLDPIAAAGGKVDTGEKRKKLTTDANFIKNTLGPDEYAIDVSTMASVSAFYRIIAARLVDNVAVEVRQGFVLRIKEALEEQLVEGLNTDDNEWCAKLLAEDPRREERRVELHAEREKCLKALDELRRLRAEY